MFAEPCAEITALGIPKEGESAVFRCTLKNMPGAVAKHWRWSEADQVPIAGGESRRWGKIGHDLVLGDKIFLHHLTDPRHLKIGCVIFYQKDGRLDVVSSQAFANDRSVDFAKIVQSPAEVHVGGTVRLFCPIPARFAVSAWEPPNGDRILQSNDRYEVSRAGGYLKILKVTAADRGMYKCCSSQRPTDTSHPRCPSLILKVKGMHSSHAKDLKNLIVHVIGMSKLCM